MKKSFLFMVSLIAAIGLWVVLRPAPAKEKEEAGTTHYAAKAPALSKGDMRFAQLAEEKPKPRDLVKPADASAVSPECLKVWEGLHETDYAAVFRFPPNPEERLPALEGCKQPPEGIAERHEKVLVDCAPFLKAPPEGTTQEIHRQLANRCQTALFFYRSNVTDWLTRDTPLAEIHDPKVLLDKMMANWETDPGRSADVADRLLEVEPDLYPAAKASMMGRFMDAQGEEGLSPEDPKWQKAEESLKRAKENNPDKEFGNLLEMELLQTQRRYGDPQRTADLARDLEEKYPREGVVAYYQAWSQHELGNLARVMPLLEEARRRSPRDVRIQETIKDYRAGTPQAFHSKVPFTVPAGSHL